MRGVVGSVKRCHAQFVCVEVQQSMEHVKSNDVLLLLLLLIFPLEVNFFLFFQFTTKGLICVRI